MNSTTSPLLARLVSCALTTALVILSTSLLFLLLWVATCRIWAHRQRQQRPGTVVAFFHPYCASGGGGERVLWKMVQVLLQHSSSSTFIVIYTIDAPSDTYDQDVVQHVQERFSIDLADAANRLRFVHLDEYRHLLRPAPQFSLLVESWRTLQLAWRALTKRPPPHVFIDTTGCAFTFVVAKLLFGCRVWAYVHYPTISTDMLALVWQQRRAAYNHAAYISQSKVATLVKFVYYCLFAVLYGATGSLADVVLVNSTWTYNHIASLWKVAAWRSRIQIVYPPCQVENVKTTKEEKGSNFFFSNKKSSRRQNIILSIGQFRPEKDHVLQMEALAQLFASHPQWKGHVKLVLLGSCRGESDQQRLKHLQHKAVEYKWTNQEIEFVVNQPYSVVQQWLSKASMGIHTMWNEHFGIGIVEMMAAGVVVVAHNSGGPQSDIVQVQPEEARTGFLASTADEYATSIHQILTKDSMEIELIRSRAQTSSLRFSDDVFAKTLERVLIVQLSHLS